MKNEKSDESTLTQRPGGGKDTGIMMNYSRFANFTGKIVDFFRFVTCILY